MRRNRLALVCALFLVAFPASALAAERMFVGFQDDPSFRWRADRATVLDQAMQANAGIVRTTVYWSRVAPQRPAQAANPFDPAYRWDDLDELVRNAQLRGIESMLTVWGTPGWANRGKGQNRAPDRVTDLQAFAQALATRYSGRNPGLPNVRFFTIWNEPNLEQFLAPTFDSSGKPASPYTYAKMYRAAYAGIKAGNKSALVGIGETSPRGRDKPSASPDKLQNRIKPGTFARLLSTVRPALKFDAWAHHPYSTLGAGPLQRARWPDVQLTQLPDFEDKLQEWFHKKVVPIWITEYGFETKPAEPKGVTPTQQAVYLKQTLEITQDMPYVEAFIWFIMRDDPTSTWQSGLLGQGGAKKPAYPVFASQAKLLDARNPIVRAKVGAPPVIRIPVLELAARDGVGATVGANIKVYGANSQFFGNLQMQSTIGVDGWATFTFPPNRTKRVYYLYFDINDKNGNSVNRSATLTIF